MTTTESIEAVRQGRSLAGANLAGADLRGAYLADATCPART